MKNLIIIWMMFMAFSCSSQKYNKTIDSLDIPSFMGRWYVTAGRVTVFEKGAHNPIENYSWNESEQRIDINFTYNKGSFDGELKSIKQKAWIHNKTTNAHWKVSPFWPLKLDYLVLDMAEDKSWVAVGLSSTSYLWIMARDKQMSESTLNEIISRLDKLEYPTHNVVRMPQKN